jgi:hypothetical protein
MSLRIDAPTGLSVDSREGCGFDAQKGGKIRVYADYIEDGPLTSEECRAMKFVTWRFFRAASPQDRIRLLMLVLAVVLVDACYWSLVH